MSYFPVEERLARPSFQCQQTSVPSKLDDVGSIDIAIDSGNCFSFTRRFVGNIGSNEKGNRRKRDKDNIIIIMTSGKEMITRRKRWQRQERNENEPQQFI